MLLPLSFFHRSLQLLLIALLLLPAAPARAQQSANEALSLHLIDAPEGVVVELVDFVALLDSLYPGARSQWDEQRGMVRILVEDHRFDALTNHAMVILDGRIQSVPRPAQVRQGQILLPIETVQTMLEALGLEFELRGGRPAETTPTPLATPTPQAGIVTPALPERTPTPTSPTATQPAAGAALPAVNLSMIVGERPAAPSPTPAPIPALQAPTGLEGRIGLSWAQLVDARHRFPPERITLLCDQVLEPAARQAAALLNRLPTYRARTITSTGPRHRTSVLNDVQSSQPELFIDLLAQPVAGDAVPVVGVWTVHDALWPEDRAQMATLPAQQRRYLAHQFQNIALGSLLKSEIAAVQEDIPVVFELSPSWLLRRMDAPSAAVLIPTQGDAPLIDAETLGQAIARAVQAYAEGMRGAL